MKITEIGDGVRFLLCLIIGTWLCCLAMNAVTGIASGAVEKRTETYRVLKATPLTPMELTTIGGTSDDEVTHSVPVLSVAKALISMFVLGGVFGFMAAVAGRKDQ